MHDNLYTSSGRVFKVRSALQKNTDVLNQKLEEAEIPKAYMKLRAKASVEVML